MNGKLDRGLFSAGAQCAIDVNTQADCTAQPLTIPLVVRNVQRPVQGAAAGIIDVRDSMQIKSSLRDSACNTSVRRR